MIKRGFELLILSWLFALNAYGQGAKSSPKNLQQELDSLQKLMSKHDSLIANIENKFSTQKDTTDRVINSFSKILDRNIIAKEFFSTQMSNFTVIVSLLFGVAASLAGFFTYRKTLDRVNFSLRAQRRNLINRLKQYAQQQHNLENKLEDHIAITKEAFRARDIHINLALHASSIAREEYSIAFISALRIAKAFYDRNDIQQATFWTAFAITALNSVKEDADLKIYSEETTSITRDFLSSNDELLVKVANRLLAAFHSRSHNAQS